MAKQVTGKAAFQVPGGKATPAPPVGTSLGKFGINLGQFVSQFNERTKEFNGTPIPVVVTVYSDRSFEFITKSPPASALLKMAAGIASGSGEPHKTKVDSSEVILTSLNQMGCTSIFTLVLPESSSDDICGRFVIFGFVPV
ncbi:MAG: uL11 family ribosomal protein, partial [Pirellula sp.]